jgi:uncharacterized membrane protein YqjE
VLVSCLAYSLLKTNRKRRRIMAITDSIARFSATIIETLQTRLELLSAETEETLARYSRYFFCSLIALFFAALGVLLSVLLIVVFFWDSHRVVAILSLACCSFVIAIGFSWWIKNALAQQPKFLALSIQELKSDVAALRSSQNHTS